MYSNKNFFYLIIVIFVISNCLVLSNSAYSQTTDDFSLPSDDSFTNSQTQPSLSSDDITAESPQSLNNTSLSNSNLSENIDDQFQSPTLSSTADEIEQVEILANKFKFSPPKESKDPFRPLIVKKVILPPPPPPAAQKPAGPPTPPPPPPPKPIQIFVSGICGNDNERLAMIKFENKDYVVTKDMVVDGKFKVIDILPDRVVIYSNKEQMRRTFTIGGGKD